MLLLCLHSLFLTLDCCHGMRLKLERVRVVPSPSGWVLSGGAHTEEERPDVLAGLRLRRKEPRKEGGPVFGGDDL